MATNMKDIARLREAARLCRREAGRAATQQRVNEFLALAQEIELRLGSLMTTERNAGEHKKMPSPAIPQQAA